MVGRNNKCPCGSGKKFKHCCININLKNTQPNSVKPKVTFSLEEKPGKKIHPPFPPDWMDKKYESIEERLSKRTDIDAFWKAYTALILTLEELPESLVSPEYRTSDIKKIANKKYAGDMLLATSTFFEFETRKLYFTNIYKIKSVIASINVAFDKGNFTTAAILMRSFLEIVSFLYYYKKKIVDKSTKFRNLLLESEKIKLNTLERDKWAKRLGKLSSDFTNQLLKSNLATSYDWKTWMQTHYGDSFSLENHEMGKLNTLTAIQYMTKETNVNFDGIYDLFSEMVHPNFGSHTLIMKKRKVIDDEAADIFLADGVKDFEQALWFFDCFANGGYETAKVCSQIVKEYSSVLKWYADFNDLQLQIFSHKNRTTKFAPNSGKLH